MIALLIVVAILVVLALVLVAGKAKGNQSAQGVNRPTPAPPASEPAPAPGASAYHPVGTPRMDDPDLPRPQVDKSVVITARAVVPPIVPDAVIADALLDATPEQMKTLLSRAPESVVKEAFGSRDSVKQSLSSEERGQLRGMGSALDDLDIWSYGDKN